MKRWFLFYAVNGKEKLRQLVKEFAARDTTRFSGDQPGRDEKNPTAYRRIAVPGIIRIITEMEETGILVAITGQGKGKYIPNVGQEVRS